MPVVEMDRAVPYIAKPIVTARDAIASHVRWKITLLTAVRLRERLSARAMSAIEHPEECAIRQWLLSAGTLAARQTPEHRAALVAHWEFHREMQQIARSIDAGEYEFAERMLGGGTSFERRSNEVGMALMALGRRMALACG
jgi:hypothetical protein